MENTVQMVRKVTDEKSMQMEGCLFTVSLKVHLSIGKESFRDCWPVR